MNMPIMFADKFNLTLEQNRFLAKKTSLKSFTACHAWKNVNTTFPQSKTMIDGMSVSGISTHDMQVLLNLKNAWQFILSSDSQFDLAFACKVNGFVAYNESLAWGELRTGNVCISGVSFVPDILLKTRLNKR